MPVEPTPTGLIEGAEELQLGRGRTTRRRSARVLVVVLIAALVLTAVVATTVRLHDARQTVSHHQLVVAFTSFQADVASDDVYELGAEDLQHGLSADPVRCAALFDLAPVGAVDGIGWSAPTAGTEADTQIVSAIRFVDPRSARAAMSTLRSSLPDCREVQIMPRQTGDGGERAAITTPDRPWWRFWGPVVYTVRPTSDDSFSAFTLHLHQYGNVVLFAAVDAGRGEPEATQALLARIDAVLGH